MILMMTMMANVFSTCVMHCSRCSALSIPTCCVRSAGPEVGKTQGNAGEKGAVCMGKHTSTCKNMIPLRNATWAHGKTQSQAAQDCRVSSLSPTAGTLCLVEGKACLGRPASPHLCQAGIHMLRWGWEEGAVGRRHEGTEFWGTNPRRNSLREPTCVQGGQKKLHPAHGKTHPLVRKHTSVWGSQQRGENTRPQLFKGPGPEKIKGLSARERRIAVRKPMST